MTITWSAGIRFHLSRRRAAPRNTRPPRPIRQGSGTPVRSSGSFHSAPPASTRFGASAGCYEFIACDSLAPRPEEVRMIKVTGTIKDGLLQKVRDSSEPGGDQHVIAWAVLKTLPFAKAVFNAQQKTVTVEFEDDRFIAFVIEKGLEK
jgi:hypothetical protein